MAVLGMLAAACSDSAPESTSPATTSQPPIAAPADTPIAPAVTASTEPQYEQILVLGSDDGIAFAAPNHLALDGNDNLYVTEFVGGRVWVFTPTGELLLQFAGPGSDVGELSRPTGIAVDSSGNIYVGESGASRVQKFARDGTPIAVWGEFGIQPGEFGSAMGVGIIEQLGRVYVADYANSRIQVFDPEGSLLFIFGDRGDAPGEMLLPIGVDIGPDNTIYVVDSGNARVQTYTPDGEFIEVFSTAPLFGPQVISVRDDGSFWVAGPSDREVILFNEAGEAIASLVPPDGDLIAPHGTETASDGTVWLADTGNNVVRAFRLVG